MAKTLGEQIKAIREAAGHSHEAAGKLVGISRQAFKKWETGDTENIKLGNLLRFCDKYHINIESLLRGNVDPTSVIKGYDKTNHVTLVVANEPQTDEREVLEGYRAASTEVKDMCFSRSRGSHYRRRVLSSATTTTNKPTALALSLGKTILT